MNFKEYDEIIESHKFDIVFMYIYYNLQLNDEFKSLNDEQKKYIISFIHDTHLKDEHFTDLGLICDVALENKEKILKNDRNLFTKWDLLNKCYERGY